MKTRIEKLMRHCQKQSKDLDFPDILFCFRETVGLKSFKCAQICGMSMDKYRRLELGTFRSMPTDEEFRGICETWGLKKDFMYKKARQHLKKILQRKKSEVYFD